MAATVQYYAHYLKIEKSLVMNTRGEVPQMNQARFLANGKDSTIQIPFDMEFNEEQQLFRAKEMSEALGGLGGATNILNGFLNKI